MPFTPAITDKFTKVGTPGTATTLAAPGFTSGVTTSINVGSTTNWPTDTLVRFAIDVATIVNGLEVRTAGTYNEFSGIVTSATTIGSMSREYGTPQNYAAGSLTRVYIPVSSSRENALIDGLGQDHNLKGNHKTLTDDNGNEWAERGQVASAVNQVKLSNAITGAAPSVEASGDDANVPINIKSKGTALPQLNGVEIDPSNSFQNMIFNGGCQVAQRTAPTISTSYQYGQVDRFAAKATGTAVSAGTISQNTAPNVVANGYALKLAGVTVTGTGIVYVRYRIEAKDALRFKNAATSFSVKIYQDTGGAINATVYIRKPTTTADTFSAVTDIANSGAISVPNTTATTVKFENINTGNIGDVTNGIEIEIQLACGAVTTKNFEFAEFQFNKGSKALPFLQRSLEQEFALCQRYFQNYDAMQWRVYTNNVHRNPMSLQTQMRTAPTLSQTNTLANLGSNSTSASATFIGFDLQFTAAGTGVIDGGWTTFRLDAEL